MRSVKYVWFNYKGIKNAPLQTFIYVKNVCGVRKKNDPLGRGFFKKSDVHSKHKKAFIIYFDRRVENDIYIYSLFMLPLFWDQTHTTTTLTKKKHQQQGISKKAILVVKVQQNLDSIIF